MPRFPAALLRLVLPFVGLLLACSAAGTSGSLNATQAAGAPAAAASISPAPRTVTTAASALCVARDGLPDPACTPGAADPRVTQANIAETICKAGYSTSVRPPSSVTEPIKVERMKAYGFTGSLAGYELDHLIPLEVGGAPADVRKLWPEAYTSGFDASRKDQIENKLHELVCSRALPLADAQHMIATDWRAAWTQYVGGR